MPPYTLLAVTSLLSAQSTAARKISTKKYLRTENVAEDASFFNRFLNADESMSAAATVAFAAIANTGGTSTDIPSKSTKSAKAAAKSAKSAKSARAIDVLTMRVDTLEKELAVLEKQTNTHHVDPSCGDNVGRINTLAAGLPEGCKLARFGPDMNTYRLVCYKPGTYNLHLPGKFSTGPDQFLFRVVDDELKYLHPLHLASLHRYVQRICDAPRWRRLRRK